jgi:hypothetical protein
MLDQNLMKRKEEKTNLPVFPAETENVFWFDVAMDNLSIVQGEQSKD